MLACISSGRGWFHRSSAAQPVVRAIEPTVGALFACWPECPGVSKRSEQALRHASAATSRGARWRWARSACSFTFCYGRPRSWCRLR
jgi:hypothetical protein